MKKVWMLFAMATVGLVLTGLTGCQEEKKATSGAAMEKAAEHPATATAPAAEKPKDHPAH